MQGEDKDAIERLKKALYSRVERPSIGNDVRTPLSGEAASEVPHTWAAPEQAKRETPMTPPLAQFMREPKKGMSVAVKFFIGSFIFFLITAGVAAYFFLGGTDLISPQNIDMQVVAPSLVNGGQAQSLQVIIDNKNRSALTNAQLIIDYPDGTRSASDPTQTLTHDTQTIGSIASGAEVKNDLNAIFYGQEGTQETVSVTLEYSVEGSNAVFQKKAEANFVVGSSPVSVSVNAPAQAISGQSFSMDVTVQANGTTPVLNAELEAQYPFGFTVTSSSPQAQSGGTLWQLGTLQPGTPQVVHIVGTLVGQNGDQRVFHFLSGSDSNPTDAQIATPFLSIPTTVTVEQPFITTAIALNGTSGSSVSIPPGSAVQGTITWTNNLSTTVTNASLNLTIQGAIFDPTSVFPSDNGFYQSSNSTITWNAQEDPDLASLAPGATGSVQFSFNTFSPSQQNLFTNPTLNLNVSVSGTRSDQNSGVPTTVNSAATAQVSVASLVTLQAQALHFTGPFTDGGPMPPTVGENTQYTVVWSVNNSSNSLANTSISTTLPPYVDFVSAGTNSGITYDDASRTVTWNLGNVQAGAGYSASAPTGAFQVILMPSLSQVGEAPALTGQSILTAQDEFAQTSVQATAQGLSTQLPSDPNFQSNMGIVVSH